MAVAQWVKAFVPHAEGWVFESQPRQTHVVKRGSDSFTAKRLAIGVSVMGPWRWPLYTDAPCHSKCGPLKNPHCWMAKVPSKICRYLTAMVKSPNEWKIHKNSKQIDYFPWPQVNGHIYIKEFWPFSTDRVPASAKEHSLNTFLCFKANKTSRKALKCRKPSQNEYWCL